MTTRADQIREALSALQPVRRDFAFLVDEGVPAEAVLRAARGADRALIADVALFDRYAGDKLPAVPGSRVLYRDGVPLAAHVAGKFVALTELSAAEAQAARQALQLRAAVRRTA